MASERRANADALGAIATDPYEGHETLHRGGRPLQSQVKVQDFWRWGRSDLLTNVDRGVFAEFLVATALGAAGEMRDPWQSWDLTTPEPEAIRVEVKSAAYLQKWAQNQPSPISFSVAPTYGWNEELGEREKEKRRQADVYVFCLLAHRNPRTIDPLDVDQWEFRVLSSVVLDGELGAGKRVSLARLERMGARVVEYSELAEAVRRAGAMRTLSKR